MSSADTLTLFRPIRVGDINLNHRIVLAPMTRLRADNDHVHTDLGVEYYKQRASVPGTLLISEGTFISQQAVGVPSVPGIWNDAQVASWKKITDAVHAKGSYIFIQLWALGRAARPALLHQENPDYPYVSSSPLALSASPEDIPRELTKEEVKEYVQWYASAAANAVHKAGFDGVEVHGAGGYLVDQFLQEASNKRTDEYGGSIEKRARFALEVIEAIVGAVGQSKTAIRLSPWSKFQDMGLKDPKLQFTYLVEQFKHKVPQLAYLHITSKGAPDNIGPENPQDEYFIHELWAPRVVVTTGGYDRESALKVTEENDNWLVGFGRPFIANPDLPFRLRKDLSLNEQDIDTFYLPQSDKGYTTYPFSDEFWQSQV
ncbi:NADH:flavin oxidoreductase/NADH oxidase [Trametes meyenii]|nr:NADH:flavin oxidoreductase/NADH oxidase [Trametes meyenii]